jgi:hypothetical protein
MMFERRAACCTVRETNEMTRIDRMTDKPDNRMMLSRDIQDTQSYRSN